ncbi:MAG TPA: hypothetical protein VMR20_11075 [Verrucomicrobiae bacterium]|nr:hypothetical protein [Verrucomicrobiae bacterium]
MMWLILLCLLFISPRGVPAGEAKPSWQATWEKTTEAAKKEGRLNLYVSRYGSEPLLNEFRKDMLVPVMRMQPAKKYFDVSDPKYADMTPMFSLIKEIMKTRESK